ncbi:MAG: hypothetical protein ACPIOQ_61800, partial [Promethearchaeia archaeon]
MRSAGATAVSVPAAHGAGSTTTMRYALDTSMASDGQFHSQRIRSALLEWNARASAPGAANSSARPRALSRRVARGDGTGFPDQEGCRLQCSLSAECDTRRTPL